MNIAGKTKRDDGHRAPPDNGGRLPVHATASPSDEELLQAYREGDRAAFTELVSRYQRELFHFLIRFMGDRAAAEDVFQDAFLQVCKQGSRPDAFAGSASDKSASLDN